MAALDAEAGAGPRLESLPAPPGSGKSRIRITVIRSEETFDKALYHGDGFVFAATDKKEECVIRIWQEDDMLHYQKVAINVGPKKGGSKGRASKSTASFNIKGGDKTPPKEIKSINMTDIASCAVLDEDEAPLVVCINTRVGSTIKFVAQTEEEVEILVEGFGDLAEAATRTLKQRSAFKNPLRLVCWALTQNAAFDNAILACIAVNCVVMAMVDPLATEEGDDDSAKQNRLLETISSILTYVFTVEMVLKLIALLPFTKEKDGYFQDNWNLLDFSIVAVSYAKYIPGFGNHSVFRLFRILRPLRSFGKLNGMRMLINTLLEDIAPLGNVVLLTSFVFFIFSVLGMELFEGLGSNRCILNPLDVAWTVMPDSMTTPIEERRCGGYYDCPAGYECRAAGLRAATATSDGISSTNQADGIRGFDGIGQALLSVFVCATLEGWVDIMYMHQDSVSWALGMIYHTLLVLIGAFLCLNLALAVIASTFEDQKEEEDEGKRAELEALGEDADIEEEEEDDEIPPPENGFRRIFYNIVNSKLFFVVGVIAILLNTAALATEHTTTECIAVAGSPTCITQAVAMKKEMRDSLEVLNYGFVIYFAVEMAMLIIGLGPMGYVKDPFNTFDGIVVIISIVEVVLEGKGTSALRVFRLARVFKVAKSWQALRTIIESLIATLPNITSCCLLLLLFMFMASVAGMQLLGNVIPGCDGSDCSGASRSRFTDFKISMLTIFSMLSGENWNEFMYEGITLTAADGAANGGYGIAFFYIFVILCGIFVVLNLFLAILLAEFDAGEAPDMSLGGLLVAIGVCPPSEDDADDNEDIGAALQEMEQSDFKAKINSNKDEPGKAIGKKGSSTTNAAGTKELNGRRRSASMNMSEVVAISEDQKAKEADEAREERLTLHGTAMGFLGTQNCFRRMVASVVRTQLFDNFILLLIVTTSIFLALDGPTVTAEDHKVEPWKTIKLLDLIFLGVFIFEIVVKWITYGIYWESKTTYFKDAWNILDFAVVVIAIVPELMDDTSSGVSSLKTLRAMRALRPLRTIKRLPGLKVVVNVCIMCIPTFINICLVVFFVFLVFAIMGVQFFAGKFWSCNDPTVVGVSECIGTFTVDGETVDHEWSNQEMNFDNTLTALLTLYEVSSLEMWLDVMYAAMDMPDKIGDQPKFEMSFGYCLFFVIFVLIGCFLVLNLFVGAVVDKFNDLKAENEGVSPMLTEAQKEYTQSVAAMIRTRPYRKAMPPRKKNPWMGSAVRECRYWCFLVCRSPKFEAFISFLIFGNVLVMGCSYWEPIKEDTSYKAMSKELMDYQNTNWNMTIDVINHLFTLAFFFEMILKFCAWGLGQYFQDKWNQYDCFLVCTSVGGFFVETLLQDMPINPSIFRILRVARLTRVLRSIRLVQRVKGLAKLVDTLTMAFPSMLNVASLLFLVLFIFTCLGMSFYGDMPTDQPYVNGMYNEHCNFKYFFHGFMLLFRSATGESWNGIMHDIMTVHPNAWAYFVAFMIFVSALLFELLTAIVLDQYDEYAAPIDCVPEEFMNNFMDVWSENDPQATKFIPLHRVGRLMCDLDVQPPIFKDAKEANIALVNMDIAMIERPDGTMEVHYVDCMMAVVKFLFVKKRKTPIDELDSTFTKSMPLAGNVTNAFRDLPSNMDGDKNEVSMFKDHFAAMKVQAIFKARLAKKRVQAKRAAAAKGGGLKGEKKRPTSKPRSRNPTPMSEP